MKFLNDISVRVKLMLITIPLAIALIVSIVFMAIEINSTEDEVSTIYYDILYSANSSLINADRDFYQSLLAAHNYYAALMTGGADEATMAGYKEDYESNAQQVLDNMHTALEAAKKNEGLFHNVKSSDGLTFAAVDEEFEKDFVEWRSIYKFDSNLEEWTRFNEEFDETRGDINTLQEITEEWAAEERTAVQATIRNKIIIISVIFGLLVAILAVIVVAVIRGIRIGLKRVTDNLEQLAGGDLNVKFPADSEIGKDDVGSITRSAKLLSDKLSEIMTKSNNMARELTNAGTDLADSASQASQASDQVTDAVTEISKGAVAQAESVETAAGNTDDIGNNIEHIAGNANDMDHVATEMKDACDNAMDALQNLIRQSREVTASVKEIGDTINSTNESARTISEFTQAITDIATQTNLLSLNASIEAARAGDAGRGFAVVADEIRQLADQSSESADKIKGIVEKLLTDSASSVSVLEKLNENFDMQATQLDATKSNMEVMNASVSSVKDTSSSISQQVSALNDAKNGLTEIISDLSAISEENAASTEETNASMEELNATFTIISESASKLQVLASELTDTISYFRV
ncbi:MAG: hypothetical protein IJ600_01980 [Lachnospiraceae bacterium]|nr:hypothetical protein [Lachnospiraceae bacterium]